ncbi:MAG: hypothetical protein KBS98_01970 [Flavobacterium sp.]|nr:hypothetical protein [Candidatus Neoflavobacterium equi]
MKKLLTLGFALASVMASAQAFNGKGDQKFQVGANIQDRGTGIMATYDYGIGENMSIGVQSNYILGTHRFYDGADFYEKFDLKARFNANIGSVMKLPTELDIYPGLDLGLHNFGGHVGARYFFSDGFGLFTEVGFAIASYDNHLVGPEHLNNQFQWNIGVSFNL